MGLILDKLQKQKRTKTFWIVFTMKYAFKIMIFIVIIWMFLTVRQDIIQIYENCEPFIIHSINISNITWQNISNLTINFTW